MSNLNPGGLTRVLNYIKTWVTGLLNDKANSSHSHTKSQITDFPTIPSNISQLTNDSGFITSSGSCNYANSSGNADTVDGSHAWQMQTLAASGVVHGSNDWLMQCQYNVDGDGYFKLYCGDKSIGTKVDRANSSGYTDWLRTSSHADHLFHTEWDGSYFWTYVTAGDGGYRGVRVERSNSSGWADSAGGVAWGNVSGRPLAVSQFTNDSGFITSSGSCASCTEAAYMGQHSTITYGVNRLQYYNTSTSTTSGATSNANPYNDWFYHLLMSHGNSGGWYGDIALCFHSDTLAFRRIVNGGDNGWCYIVKNGRTIVSGYEVYVG